MKEYRPITDLEARAIKALQWPTYPVASFPKRFARNMASATMLTEKQAATIWSQLWRFRRQIDAPDLVEHARRMTVPNVEGAFLQ